MSLDRLDLDLELKQVNISQRVISGYAAVHSTVDRNMSILDPGALTKTLTEKTPAQIAVFIGHQKATLPVGIPLVIRLDSKGLWTETLIKPGPGGDDLLETARFLLQHGQPLGQSIGYRVRDRKMERVNGKFVERLMDIDLCEYSYLAVQSVANPEALVMNVKQGAADMPMYEIEPDGNEFVVMRAMDDQEMGRYATRAEAEAAMAALMKEEAAEGGEGAKAVWTTAFVNNLPDSAFLLVESGGTKDETGRTVPRALRHFPYKGPDGSIDLPHLRNAIARIPQSSISGFDAAAQKRLQARAQRMLEQAQSGSKTLAELDPPEFREGAPPLVRYVGTILLDYAEQIADAHKAMRLLGEETKLGARMQAPMRAKLQDAIRTLQDIVLWAETVDAGRDAQAKVARYQAELQLLSMAGV